MCRASLLPLLLALFITSGCGSGSGGQSFDLKTSGGATPERGWLVHQAQADGKLLFVVFECGPSTEDGFEGRLTSSYSKGRTSAELTRPDGSVSKLPGRVQLIEVVDGVYRDSERTVTLAELEAFLASKPAAYTIEELLRFVDERRGG
ncbi:MAG TPA: hypothetical protein VM533_06755 [Fimbriiglobus sp.]|nr:hypothetical protein [Fimbriiglobus sp.]